MGEERESTQDNDEDNRGAETPDKAEKICEEEGPEVSTDREERKEKHKAPDKAIRPTKEEIVEPEALTQKGNLTCTNCQKTFTENSNMRKHNGPFHTKKMFYCTECTKSSTGRDRLKTHLARHEEARESVCDVCGEQCKTEDKLGKHGKRM